MIKDYIKIRNESIYKISKNSNIPYTTLNEIVLNKKNICDCNVGTLKKLAKYFNITIEALIDICENKNIIISNSWYENKYKKFKFNNITNYNYDFLTYIHPLNQKKIAKIYNSIKDIQNIKRVIIFGSSVNIRCNKNSDIDIYIDLKDKNASRDIKNNISDLIQKSNDYNESIDIIWSGSIDEKTEMYKNIMNGIIIYE